MLKTNKLELEKVNMNKLKVSNFKLRSIMEPDQNLKDNIYEKGQINPLITLNDYTLISGHRRYAALKKLGARKVWVLKMSDLKRPEILEYQLSEALHSKDLNPIDKGRAFKQLMDSKKLSIRKLAKVLNTSKTAIEWHLKLLDLPPKIKVGISEGKLKPYGIRMNSLYGKKKLKTTKDFLTASNEILYKSLMKRITSMKILIPHITFTEEESKKVKELITKLLDLVKTKELQS